MTRWTLCCFLACVFFVSESAGTSNGQSVTSDAVVAKGDRGRCVAIIDFVGSISGDRKRTLGDVGRVSC